MKRDKLNVNKYYKQLWLKLLKWHLHTKHIENKVDLYHDSDRDEERKIKSKQIL